MAVPTGGGGIILTTTMVLDGLDEGLKMATGMVKNAAKAMTAPFVAIGSAVASATVAITKMSVSAYADYEQLVGGVNTLFGDSAAKVLAYAEDAFFYAGLSANEYMQNVTSFAAALISSTAGDTELAADIANTALTDISDNVNKLGSSIESVTMAFQSFAKQQYVLLDNLKLGYFGTKTEMERLLRDAEALTGVKYDINNLADVYTAIHEIQKKMRIVGATADEAERTITGSTNMMKAAWQNVLTTIASGGDLDKAINNFAYSVVKVFDNILPAIERSLYGISGFIEKVTPVLVQNIAVAILRAIPVIVQAVINLIVGVVKGIWGAIKAIFTGGSVAVLTKQLNTGFGGISNSASSAADAIEKMGDAAAGADQKAKKSLAAFDDLQILSSPAGSGSGGGGIGDIGDVSVVGGGGGIGSLVDALEMESEVSDFVARVQEKLASLGEFFKNIWDSSAVQSFLSAVQSSVSFASEYAKTIWRNYKENLSTMIIEISPNIQNAAQNLNSFFTGVWTDISNTIDEKGAKITEQATTLFNSIWKEALIPAAKQISKIWSDVTGSLSKNWSIHGNNIINGIGDFVENTIELFQKLWDGLIAPIIEPLLEEFGIAWDGTLSEALDGFISFVFETISGGLRLANEVFFPLAELLVDVVSPAFTSMVTGAISLFGTLVTYVSDVLSAMRGIFDGIIWFIKGTFTANWKTAWQGVKDVFSSIVSGLGAMLKTPLNVAISLINGLINGLNRIRLPDWDILGGLAGKGFNIPRIPKLATGGIVPSTTVAMIGERGREAVLPLENNTEWMDTLADRIISRGGVGIQKEEHYYIDNNEIMTLIYRLAKGGERLDGVNLVKGSAY